jgi:hypothetical protein
MDINDILTNADKIRSKLLAEKQTKTNLRNAYVLIGRLKSCVCDASSELNALKREIEKLKGGYNAQ